MLHEGKDGDFSVLRDFKIMIRESTSGTWKTIDEVTGNTRSVTERKLAAPAEARYVRLEITQGNAEDNTSAIVREFALYRINNRCAAESPQSAEQPKPDTPCMTPGFRSDTMQNDVSRIGQCFAAYFADLGIHSLPSTPAFRPSSAGNPLEKGDAGLSLGILPH